MSLVSTNWLQENLDNVKIIDCSWHMPRTKRDGFDEYLNRHIKKSIFFDLDKNSKKDINLPHMLVSSDEWQKIVSEMGIKNDDLLVIYDNSDLISSCRCWYNFIYFGHSPNLVKVLNGGLRKWIKESKETTSHIESLNRTNYQTCEIKKLVKSKKEIDENIITSEFKLVDARSINRFKGLEVEPRKGVRSGSIQNSVCLPFEECINKKTYEFLSVPELKAKFEKIINSTKETNIIFSCGSGVTAAVLAFALSLINESYLPIIYDGSWSEYGKYPS